ncbi:hypothetical protein K470DRAFT_259538 [Piedraia hortae CBS 480.64]|uniref:Cysteine protease n=1 Tax=Piedraia hortae CBS 480.64 TaxID=1314780 RepID=A0A6A7BVJ3_9PEZI|nr:hypothetical protein K470DRAFT_259538 [Piedraia hortae CBS 480.64]
MAESDISRLSKKVVRYFWDPPARNEDDAEIWCLGRHYDSRFHARRAANCRAVLVSTAHSQSDSSQAESGAVIVNNDHPEQSAENGKADLTTAEEEALGWPLDFLDDLEARIWLTYRNGFPLIPRSADSGNMSFAMKMRMMGNQNGYTSDTGWGCMIRSGQSLLANTLTLLQLGREWRLGQNEEEHKKIMALFADNPEAPFSIHKFVDHGAQFCGKPAGEWFGPSATARSLQALTSKYDAAKLRVYSRPDDGDVYADSILATAAQKSADDEFQPTLIVLGVRLGIDRVTPVYHAALKAALEMPQSVGIAGGRPSSSHYFIGHQGDNFLYLDPHYTRAQLPLDPTAADIASCHTRRVRKLHITEMDPSMLLGFLIRSTEDFQDWCKALVGVPGTPIIHVHEDEPKYANGRERPEAVDEVETWDEGEDE